MRLVVDANILFAALLREGSTANLLAYGELELFAPSMLFTEFEKYAKMLEQRTHDSAAFAEAVTLFRKKIELVEPTPEYFREGEQISPDPKDAAYLALALQLSIPLWTNDRALKEQRRVRVYTTAELLSFLR